jgi:dihydroorotase
MLLLKNITVVSPYSDINGQLTDILIDKNGKIEKISPNIKADSKIKVFEREGACVSIGWMDIGTQVCDPGYEHREDLTSVARAAMAGGFTAIAPYPNTKPAIHSKSEVLYIKNKTYNYLVNFYPIGALSVDCQGKDLAEMLDMHHAGAIAFSDGYKSTQNGGLLLRGLQYSTIFKGLILNSPYDKTISPQGQMHEGLVSTSLGLPGIPSMAEELMIQRDLQLLEYAGSRLHFQNISTARSVDLIKQAKKQGLKVTASTPILNLCFDESQLRGFDSHFKLMPPLRENSDREALIKGIKDGTIDFITTNHTPIDIEGKNLEFPYAEFGAITLESAFALSNTFLHKKLTINQLIENWAIHPRRVFNIKMPEITEGVVADLTIFNPQTEWNFKEKDIYSKSNNSPIVGQKLRGAVLGVINKGQYWLREN